MTDQEFKEMVWSKSKDHLIEYPKWFQVEFVEYWLTIPDNSKKTRFNLLPKKRRDQWSTLGTMAQCKRSIYRTDPRWAQEAKMDHPDYYSKRHVTSLNDNRPEYLIYKNKLKGLGFIFDDGGAWVTTPENKRIWL